MESFSNPIEMYFCLIKLVLCKFCIHFYDKYLTFLEE